MIFCLSLFRFYQTKSKRIQVPHVVGHYAAGARLIGLTENQIRKRMERLKASHAAGGNKSPYAEPLYIVFGKVRDVLYLLTTENV